MEILINFIGILRTIGMALDSIVFGLVDNAYNLINDLARNPLFDTDTIKTIMQNLYVVMGLFAFFRVAIILVNAIINPDKLTEKGNGIANVGINILIMFAMLIAVPTVFEKAYKIQELIVDNHVVDKLFLNTETLEKSNPGRAMQSIAIGALITWNENITSCSGKCQDAKTAYENMAAGKTMTGEDDPENGGFKMTSLAKYASVQETVNGEKEFVYIYKAMLTFVVGIFLTYILFSFAIDIGIRTVELAVLQIVAPLFIATYVDPKSAKSGPFKNWVTTTLKTYASLFIKLAIISLTLLLISLIPKINFSKWYEKGIGKLTVLISILIFAKKAPEWIGKLIGIDAGLGGLGIGKKLGSAALIGGALTKVGHKVANTAAAAGAGGVRGFINENKNRRAEKKAVRDKNENLQHTRKARQSYSTDGASGIKGYFNQRKHLNEARKEAYGDAGISNRSNAKRLLASTASGIINSASLGFKADNIKGALNAAKTATDNFAGRVGMNNKNGIYDRALAKIMRLPGAMENVYGTPSSLADKRDAINKQKKVESWTKGGNYGIQEVGIGQGKVVAGQGDANKIMDAMTKSKIDINNDTFGAVQYGLNQGMIKLENGKISGLSASGISLTSDGKIENVKFDNGKTVTGESISKDCGGIFNRDSSAMQNQEKLVNSYQTTAINNYSQNNDTMQQAVSAYNAAKQNISDESLSSLNIRNGLMQAMSGFDFGSALVNLSIGDSISQNIKNIENAISDATKRMAIASDEEKATLERQIDQLEKMEKNAKEYADSTSGELLDKDEATKISDEEQQFYSTMTENIQVITEINDAQKELKLVIDKLPGGTLADKVNQLAISAKKIDDKIKSIEEKEEKK